MTLENCHILSRFFQVLICMCSITYLECTAQSGFGSEKHLSEQLVRQRWQSHQQVNTMAGLSLIGSQWRGFTSVHLGYFRYPFSAKLDGTLRYGPLGGYTPDWDNAYDLLRVIEFARIQTDHLYIRIGPIQDLRLGIGHIVNHYRSSTSWDDRTVGAEMSWDAKKISIQGFTADLLLNNLIGVRATADVFLGIKIGVNYSNHLPSDLIAWSLDLEREVFETARVVFAPYVSFARYPKHGEGLAFGADVRSSGFLDLLSFRLRVGAFYNSEGFIPGYIGTLFSVNNPTNRIIRNNSDIEILSHDSFSGILLEESRGINDLLTEFELQIQDTFWLAYSWRRHFGGQPLSELYFRLFVRGGQYFTLEVGVDRLGERVFGNIFSAFSEQSSLMFATVLRVSHSIFLHTEARYTFEPIDDIPNYLVQRRFEPTLGIRLNL